MKLSTKLIPISSAALVLYLSSSPCPSFANFQEAELPLALKIIRTNVPDETFPVSKGVSTTRLYGDSLKMISSQAPKSPTGVEIQSKVDDDAIKARVKVLFDDPDDEDSLKDREENFIGTFVLRDGESALLSGLERHNIEPFELKAVKAESVDVPLDQAPLRNQTRAIQATGLTLNKEVHQAHIRLKNVSGKNIIGYTICDYEPRGDSTCQRGAGLDLKPGDEKTLLMGFPSRSFRRGPGGFIELPTDGHELVIRTAVFEDGSFEGDPDDAGMILGKQARWKIKRGK